MYRADDPRWTPAQRAAIAAFAGGFEPAWEPGEGFSATDILLGAFAERHGVTLLGRASSGGSARW